jgi:GR25 family glycosyltransferase involved in LPS biosynthesis
MSFNWKVYRELNLDLVNAGLKTEEQFNRHFLIHGRRDKRLNSVYQLYPDFNPIAYKRNNSDLSNLSIPALELHWIKFGRFEKRIYETATKTKYNLINGIGMIYWINLDRCVERKNNMLNMLKDTNVLNERISAVDGKTDNNILSNFIIEKNDPKNRNIYEYACLLSHLNTIKKFYRSRYSNCLILEDDCSMEFYKYWNKDINTVINSAPSDWEIIMLNYIIDTNTPPLNDTYNVWRPDIYSTLSYIINKKGASKIMNMYKNNMWVITDNTHTSDYVVYNMCRTYVYKYCYFTINNNNDSTIHDNHISFQIASKYYSGKIWNNNNNN